jgi:hypothetical protein
MGFVTSLSAPMFGGFLSSWFSSPPPSPESKQREVEDLQRELQLASAQLQHIDNPAYYPHEVRYYEWNLDRLRKRMQSATTSIDREIFEAAMRIGEEELHHSRQRMTQYSTDRLRFVDLRRRELEMQVERFQSLIQSLHPPSTSLASPPKTIPSQLRQRTKTTMEPNSSASAER